MNFLFILNTFYPNIGGVENATLEICKRLKKRGHKVYVLTTSKSNFYPNNEKLAPVEEIDGIQIFRVRSSLRTIGMPLKALYLATKFKIDYNYVTDFWGFTALFLKKTFRIPFVYILNGYNPICPRGTLNHEGLCRGFEFVKCFKQCRRFSLRFFCSLFITRLLLREADPVIAISKSVQNAYRSHFGRIPLKLLYYGVDQQKFRPFDIRASDLHYNINDLDKIILFFGRFIKERGIIEFLLHFKEQFTQVQCKLIIVGLGSTVSEIRSEINTLELQKDVILTGPLRNQDLVQVINLSNIVILPIQFPEPLSLVVLEAMACGKPVVSFALGGVRELIDHAKTGYILQPNDWNGFIDKINKLLKNIELATSLGDAGRLKMEKYFNWEIFIEKFLKLLTRNG